MDGCVMADVHAKLVNMAEAVLRLKQEVAEVKAAMQQLKREVNKLQPALRKTRVPETCQRV